MCNQQRAKAPEIAPPLPLKWRGSHGLKPGLLWIEDPGQDREMVTGLLLESRGFGGQVDRPVTRSTRWGARRDTRPRPENGTDRCLERPSTGMDDAAIMPDPL